MDIEAWIEATRPHHVTLGDVLEMKHGEAATWIDPSHSYNLPHTTEPVQADGYISHVVFVRKLGVNHTTGDVYWGGNVEKRPMRNFDLRLELMPNEWFPIEQGQMSESYRWRYQWMNESESIPELQDLPLSTRVGVDCGPLIKIVASLPMVHNPNDVAMKQSAQSFVNDISATSCLRFDPELGLAVPVSDDGDANDAESEADEKESEDAECVGQRNRLMALHDKDDREQEQRSSKLRAWYEAHRNVGRWGYRRGERVELTADDPEENECDEAEYSGNPELYARYAAGYPAKKLYCYCSMCQCRREEEWIQQEREFTQWVDDHPQMRQWSYIDPDNHFIGCKELHAEDVGERECCKWDYAGTEVPGKKCQCRVCRQRAQKKSI